MTFFLFEAPIESVRLDESKYPDREKGLIFEHLLLYCSKFDPLPAISIAVDGGELFVTGGHKYLECAAALGRRTIRAVLPSASDDVIKLLLRRSEVKPLDWDAIKKRESIETSVRGWHVLFFERPLSAVDKLGFESQVSEQFDGEAVHVSYDNSRRSAEFEAQTPLNDFVWARALRERLSLFSRRHVQIVSYQGRRFGA